MSPKGRPEGEYRSAQHEGTPVSPKGRPKGEYRSAQREGTPVTAPRSDRAARTHRLRAAARTGFAVVPPRGGRAPFPGAASAASVNVAVTAAPDSTISQQT